jgi:hypothetical protein
LKDGALRAANTFHLSPFTFHMSYLCGFASLREISVSCP